MTISLDRVGTPVPAVRPSTSPAPAPARSNASTGKAEKRPFVSGFCGGGPTCRDTGSHCKGMFENGIEAKTKTVFCACACHTENPAQ